MIDVEKPSYLLVKRGLYYRPDNQGYTGIKDHAGRYHSSDAYEGVMAIHEDDAPEFSSACFDDLKVAHLVKQRDEARAAILALAEREKRMREALEDIGNPLAAAQRHAEAQGARLSGEAYAICNSLSYVQDIARRAFGEEKA